MGSWGTPGLCGASHPLSKGQSPALSGAVCLQIREEIDHYGIRIYQFPECDSDEDEEFKLQDQALKVGLAPPGPLLGEQSPTAERAHRPRVPLGLFGTTQALQQHGVVGTCCHQDPTGATCSLMGWGWGGETHTVTAAIPAGALLSQGSQVSWQTGAGYSQGDVRGGMWAMVGRTEPY